MKILTILGASPQFIKVSAVSRAEALFDCEIMTDSSIYGDGRAAEKNCRLIRTRLD